MGDTFVMSTPVEENSSEVSAEGTLTPQAEAIVKNHGVLFIQRYALKLLHSMLNNEKNFVINPLVSFCSVNAMGLGANGSSREELTKALMDITFENEADESAVMSKIKSCLEETTKVDNLKIPAYLYVNNEFKICDHFKEFSNFYFGVTAKDTDFSEKAVIYINEKIKYDTDSHIGSTIKELGDGIKMLLIDCSYFGGLWKQGFWQTKPSNFTNYNDTTSEVDFMHAFGKFRTGFNNKLQCHMIELPYNSDAVNMLILMPEKGVSFQSFIDATSGDMQLLEIIHASKLKYEQTEIWLPKFRSEFIISMKAFYRQHGVHDIFDSSKADFSRLVDSKGQSSHYGLFLGDIVQKVVFEVKSEGTRTLKMADAIDTSSVFKCNRPFLFFVFLQHKQAQLVLFQGAVKLL